MKMHAVVVNKDVAGDVEVVERELRPLEYGEALVEVEYCGVCPHRLARCGRRLRRQTGVACWDTRASVWLKKLPTV